MSTYNTLRAANVARQLEWGQPSGGLTFRAIEWAGEVGELADALRSKQAENIADEAADVLITTDLLAIDLFPDHDIKTMVNRSYLVTETDSASVIAALHDNAMAVLNQVKKVARAHDGLKGSLPDQSDILGHLLNVTALAQMVLAKYGFGRHVSVQMKFNRTSTKNGFSTLLDFAVPSQDRTAKEHVETPPVDHAAKKHVETGPKPSPSSDDLGVAGFLKELLGDGFEVSSIFKVGRDGKETLVSEDEFIADLAKMLNAQPDEPTETPLQQGLRETPPVNDPVWVSFCEGLALTFHLTGEHEMEEAVRACILKEPTTDGALIDFPKLTTVLIVNVTEVMRREMQTQDVADAARATGIELLAESLGWIRDEFGTTAAERFQAHIERKADARRPPYQRGPVKG